MNEITKPDETHDIVLRPDQNVQLARDVAVVCKAIVSQTVQEIRGKKHIKVEGWQAIAAAHGCALSATNVEKIEGGYRATGQVRRGHDGVVIAEAQGFVGDDETDWAKRPVFARRAMAQTRAMSRAARSAFAYVVVLMDAGLSTTPAEEMEFAAPEEKVVNANPNPAQDKDQENDERRQIDLNEEIPKWYWKVPKDQRRNYLPPGCGVQKGDDNIWRVVMRAGGD
jgi:hypothetical protein